VSLETRISKSFPWRVNRERISNALTLQAEAKGERDVFISRAKAGFGGMVTVSAVLLAVQLISGIQAFPL
jgi:hypothetical protein